MKKIILALCLLFSVAANAQNIKPLPSVHPCARDQFAEIQKYAESISIGYIWIEEGFRSGRWSVFVIGKNSKVRLLVDDPNLCEAMRQMLVQIKGHKF